MRPNVIAMEIADEPPYEINGSVIPLLEQSLDLQQYLYPSVSKLVR